MSSINLTGPKAANQINKLLMAFTEAHHTSRFPVDVAQLAVDCHEIFGWKDPIAEVRSANIPGFEGCLFPNDEKSKWLLLFNEQLGALGRVRFTQAHELGHYVLHRKTQDLFQCASAADMRNLSKDVQNIEHQADEFASFLLMPLDDFRKQLTSDINLDLIAHCANRYGVSLTAAALKWLSQTTQKAVLIVSSDGFINWSWSSDTATKAGAFFKTRSATIEVPSGSLAADVSVQHERSGKNVRMSVWFPHADPGLSLTEMKISSERYGVFTLLLLPSIANVWPTSRFA
ncbi:ImmA/IrrE family metallo-endopeptidase [Collimonas fungivorans]|uniref:ImmA/IrrE family metallo-endopeptidase n=1 Tax=Collimonas fungivorans TaxID=158899 RepID=UPI000778533D|nr:ImmA/IrrE family metallo-endopeptidase [Collimonas fungivorans]